MKAALTSSVLGLQNDTDAVATYSAANIVVDPTIANVASASRHKASPLPDRCHTITSVVIGWNSFLEGSDVSTFIARSEQRFVAAHGDVQGKTLLCTNLRRFGPSMGAGLGALSAGEPLVLKPDAVTARCAGGVMLVKPQAALALAPLPGGNMHYHDVALFYGDLRADAIRRSVAFSKQARKRR